jgi:hypothetical protein
MDIETVLINNTHVPYLICWFDGLISNSFWIKNLNKEELESNIFELIKNAIKNLLSRKYKSYKIYLHNFSKFDGIFLLKHLSELGDINPVIHDGKFISITFNDEVHNHYEIVFKDSLLLLLVASLLLEN